MIVFLSCTFVEQILNGNFADARVRDGVEDAAQVRFATSAGIVSAKVLKLDSANDLALLKAEEKFPALFVTASRAMKLGGTMVTMRFGACTFYPFNKDTTE